MAELIRERFREPADEFASGFTSSVKDDRRLVEHDIRGSVAHARMLAKQGIVTEVEGAAMVRALEQILAEWRTGTFQLDPAHDDVHMNVEARLIEILGPSGARLHAGRSRNDQVSLDLRLWVREEGARIRAKIVSLREALLARAAEHADTLIPGTTHLQHAQPLVFGHVLLCYHDRLLRDEGRFEDALRRADVSPLGAGAIAGTTLPIDPPFSARELGFARAFTNSLDAVSDRDYAVEFAAAAALLMVHLSQLAEDLILWSTPEFAFVELPDALTTSSSLMPQKKNPDMIELVRARAAGVMGRLVTLLATLKALPLGYNRDLQETKPALFEVADVTLQSLHAVEIAIARMRIDTRAMEEAANDPGMLATDLAEYLVDRGVPFRDAHGAVARLMKWCAGRGVSLLSLTLPDLREHSPAFGEDALGILTPRASVTRRNSPGGTSPQGVKQRIAELRGS